jgi:site-specific recombinase XerD
VHRCRRSKVLLRHRSIETTQICAKVDVAGLRQIAQPRPAGVMLPMPFDRICRCGCDHRPRRPPYILLDEEIRQLVELAAQSDTAPCAGRQHARLHCCPVLGYAVSEAILIALQRHHARRPGDPRDQAPEDSPRSIA